MPAPRTLQSLVFALPLALVANEARPCSLVPPAQTGGAVGLVSRDPILVAERDDARLTGPAGVDIPIASWTPPPELADARGGYGQPLFFFRAGEPLGDGDYQFDSGRVAFTVSGTVTEALPDPRGGELGLFIDNDPDDGGGPLGCDNVAGCGDVTSLVISLPASARSGLSTNDVAPPEPSVESPDTFLVTFSTPDGRSFRRLVSDVYGFGPTTELRFYNGFDETGHLREIALCISVAGVSTAGEVGPAIDLGCIDPDDGSDARVTNEGGGCSSLGGARRAPTLTLLAMWLGLMRWRRRRLGPVAKQTDHFSNRACL